MLKGQVVVDFIVEFTEEIQEDQQADKDYDSTWKPQVWIVYINGASSQQGSGISVHLETPFGCVDQSVTLGFEASNNKVEYEVVLYGLEMTHHLDVEWWNFIPTQN